MDGGGGRAGGGGKLVRGLGQQRGRGRGRMYMLEMMDVYCIVVDWKFCVGRVFSSP